MDEPDHPLSPLPEDQHEDALDAALATLQHRARRLILRYLADFPASTAAEVHRGLRRRMDHERSQRRIEDDVARLRRSGLLRLHRTAHGKDRGFRRPRIVRYSISEYGKRWLRVIYGQWDLEPGPFPDDPSKP